MKIDDADIIFGFCIFLLFALVGLGLSFQHEEDMQKLKIQQIQAGVSPCSTKP